jgi:hypothetical protein
MRYRSRPSSVQNKRQRAPDGRSQKKCRAAELQRKGTRKRRPPSIAGILPVPNPEQKYGGNEHNLTSEQHQVLMDENEVAVMSEIERWFGNWEKELKDTLQTDQGLFPKEAITQCLFTLCKVPPC